MTTYVRVGFESQPSSNCFQSFFTASPALVSLSVFVNTLKVAATVSGVSHVGNLHDCGWFNSSLTMLTHCKTVGMCVVQDVVVAVE